MRKINNFDMEDILFPLAFVFSAYTILNINMSYWILALLIAIKIAKGHTSIINNNDILIFILLIAFHQLVMTFIFPLYALTIVKNVVEAVILTITVLYLAQCMKLDSLLYHYLFIAIVVSIPILIQYLEITILNQTVTPIRIFPNLISESSQWLRPSNRPVSFFVEPEAFSTFLLPLIGILLLKSKYKLAIFFSIFVLLSMSLLGFLMLSFIWLMKLITYERKHRLTLTLFILSLVIVFTNFELISTIFSRIINLDLSNEVRISQGFQIWKQMPISDMIMGIGKRDILNYIIDNNIYVQRMDFTSDSSKWTYVSTISGILIYYGLFGLILFSILMIKLVRRAQSTFVKYFILSIIVLAFGRTLLFNAWFVLWFTIAIKMIYNSTNKENYKYENRNFDNT